VRQYWTRSPSARRAATSPIARPAPPPAQAPGHLPRHPRQDEAPLLRGPLRSVTSTWTKSGPDRDRDRLSRIARAAVLDAIAGQLPGYQQDGDIPARVHRAGHPVREPASDPRPRRPPRIRHALPNRHPSHQRTRPSRPPDCGITGPPDGTRGMHARLGGPRQARDTPPARPVRGRPWNHRRCAPTVTGHQSRPLCVRGHRDTSTRSDTPRYMA
jgi:hypothetical protein